MLSYFEGKDSPVHEGVDSLWFDNVSCTGAFRDYEQASDEINVEPGKSFHYPAQSFFVHASEAFTCERA